VAEFAFPDHFVAFRFGFRRISSLKLERRPKIGFTRFFPRCMLASDSAFSDSTMKLWFAPIVCLALLSCSSSDEAGRKTEPAVTSASAPPPAAGGYGRTEPVPSTFSDLPPTPAVAPGSSPAAPSIEQY